MNPKKKTLLDQAAEIILNLVFGCYTQEQAKAAPELLEVMLRHHYERRDA